MAQASLDGVLLKIDRAKNHLRNLDRAIKRFRKADRYEIAIQDNAQTGHREWVVTRADPLPSTLTLQTGDVIHNLRSALDHLVNQLVIANGGKPTNTTAFPLWPTKAKYEAGRPGKADGISKKALNVLDSLKPYKGGNPALWTLHHLDIIDKHRLLLAVAEAHQNIILDLDGLMTDIGAFGYPSAWPNPPSILAPEKRQRVVVGTVLFRWVASDAMNTNVDFTFGIALDEPEVLQCEPLLPTLQQLTSAVEGVVALFAPLL